MVAINPSRKHGIVSLESHRGRLRVSIPRACFGGEQKRLSLGMADTPDNRSLALKTLKAMQSDIDLGTFDITLERYKPKAKQQSYLKAVSELQPQMTLIELWESYLVFLKPIRKESTIHSLVSNVSPKIRQCPYQSPHQAIDIRNWLLNFTTVDQTKKVLTQLNAACTWGIQYKKLIAISSPFEGMAKEFKYKYEIESIPNAFTLNQRDRVLDAFRNHKIKGYNYSHYALFVEFMFLTGCRPNEAVGLEWNDINIGYSSIIFNGGISMTCGKKFSSKTQGSKTNRIRKFPCNEKLRELLLSIPKNHDFLVFPSPKGTSINYDNFVKRAWHSLVDPIKPNTTPYSCRDTFITEQIGKGVSVAVIAKWVDNSVKTIEKYYLDMTAIEHILPQ